MIKYICDICNSEIQSSGNPELIGLRLNSLDFTNKVVHLCETCYEKFDEAKKHYYDEYKTRYDELNADYLEDITSYIEGNESESPSPVWE